MSAQLTQIPPVIAFNRNAMPVELTTDNINPDRAYVDLNFTGFDGPLVGQTLTIAMGLTIWAFTFAEIPDNSGWQLPIKTTQTPQEWWQYLAERFRINHEVSDFFLVLDDYPNIRLRYRKTGPLSINTVSTLTDVAVAAHAVASVVNVDNLAALIAVHDAETHETLLELAGAYSLEDRKCRFDIRAAFADVRPSLPTEFAPNPTGVFLQLGEQRAIYAYRRYYIRYADRYGTPPKPEIMHRSNPAVLTALQGGIASGNVADFFNRPIVALHNYFSPSLGMPFVKSVTQEQPDWLYFICPNGQTSIQAECVLRYSDGAERILPRGTFNAIPGQIQIYPTGFQQLMLHRILPDVGTPATKGFPVGYDFRLRLSDNSIALTLTYELELFAAWNMYLLLDNGVGGMETVRLKGQKTKTMEGESVIFEKNDGSLSTAFSQGFTRYEASTGWYEAYQAEHLAQLLLGKIWLIEPTDNPNNPKFVPVIADKQSVTFDTDDADEGLHALNLKFRTAETQTQFNNF